MSSLSSAIYRIFGIFGVAIFGYIVGYQLASQKYESTLYHLKAEQTEKVLKIEREWQDKTTHVEKEYQEKLRDIQQSNDDTVNRLRQQLNEYARKLSQTAKSSSKPNGRTRESELSERIGDVIEFSNRCAKRADELSIQLQSLQQWIKEVDHVEEEVLIK